eukprot:gnl/TRDRNA2_/TRDRNA2_69892_c0_seq1.p1 gnl/TRDRNA2_/TRDRNA2_69892_c0~~gnl/TRDRNA2_/TRDRNA2_69892_c0_seq1.p1  ORF type:complete len:162 (+),score=31.24 gnl/TRDRNA2_/TRDRNA2_69892_c0_seq1:72-557(+)
MVEHREVFGCCSDQESPEVQYDVEGINTRGLVNSTWAFASVGLPAPALLLPFKVLDEIEAQESMPPAAFYSMLVQSLVTSGQVVAGFELLSKAQAAGLLSLMGENCYAMFHLLLAVCRATGDSGGASRVKALQERIGFSALAPIAAAQLQGSSRWLPGEGR